MSTDRNNETNGKFDIVKESKIVADLVVGELMYTKIITKKDSDLASIITAKKFLAFRKNRNPDIANNKIDIKVESDNLARVVVDALVSARIIKKEHDFQAFEIAAEEILVRRSMESLRKS